MDELLFAGFCLILYWTYEYMIYKYSSLEELLSTSSERWKNNNVELRMKINFLRVHLNESWEAYENLLHEVKKMTAIVEKNNEKLIKIHDITFDNSKDMKDHVYIKLMEAIL